jgi:hypothetical protein
MFVRCRVKYEDKKFNIKVQQETTVAMLQIKLRAFLKVNEAEALFLFISVASGRECLYNNNKLLIDIGSELTVSVCKENAFGTWSKMFIKASISQKKGLFICVVTWSYYGLYYFEEVSVHDTMESAKDCILTLRTAGHLTYEKE